MKEKKRAELLAGDVSWIRMGHPFVIPEENGGEMWFWIR